MGDDGVAINLVVFDQDYYGHSPTLSAFSHFGYGKHFGIECGGDLYHWRRDANTGELGVFRDPFPGYIRSKSFSKLLRLGYCVHGGVYVYEKAMLLRRKWYSTCQHFAIDLAENVVTRWKNTPKTEIREVSEKAILISLALGTAYFSIEYVRSIIGENKNLENQVECTKTTVQLKDKEISILKLVNQVECTKTTVQLKYKDLEISKLKNQVQEISKLENQVKDTQTTVQLNDQQISILENQVKDTQTTVQLKDQQISELENQVKDTQTTVQLNDQIGDRNFGTGSIVTSGSALEGTSVVSPPMGLTSGLAKEGTSVVEQPLMRFTLANLATFAVIGSVVPTVLNAFMNFM